MNKILKTYDFVKNRSIAQKDIYSLRKGNRSVFVNNEEYPLLCYKDCEPLPEPNEETSTPFEFRLQEVIDLLQNMETEFKKLSDSFDWDVYFDSTRQKADLKRILNGTAHIIENYRNELRIIAHAHEQENRDY